MKGELSVVSKQKQYSSNKVPILVEGDIATDMEEVKKFLHILILDGYKQLSSNADLCQSVLPLLLQNLFRLGIRWDLFPHKRWKNNTIYYYIDPIYGKFESSYRQCHILRC